MRCVFALSDCFEVWVFECLCLTFGLVLNVCVELFALIWCNSRLLYIYRFYIYYYICV